jgi:hypothetical protein
MSSLFDQYETLAVSLCINFFSDMGPWITEQLISAAIKDKQKRSLVLISYYKKLMLVKGSNVLQRHPSLVDNLWKNLQYSIVLPSSETLWRVEFQVPQPKSHLVSWKSHDDLILVSEKSAFCSESQVSEIANSMFR